MNKFNFRAEARMDLEKFLSKTEDEVKVIKLNCDPEYFDMDIEVTILTSYSMKQIKDLMETVPDGHIMIRTLTSADDGVKLEANTQRLIKYLTKEPISEEKAQILMDLLAGKYKYTTSQETMRMLGYSNYDWAKPQPYMDQLRDNGVPNEMLQRTVFDYTKNRYGELSSVAVRHYNHIITALSE